MSVFIDTNIIVNANDAADPVKQEQALALISRCMRDSTGVLSTQVIQEYAATAVQKLGQAVPVVLHQIHLLEFFRVITLSPGLVRRALEIQDLYNLSFWDSQIIASAEHAGCTLIYSEHLNPGQFYCGMRLVNPFGGNHGPL